MNKTCLTCQKPLVKREHESQNRYKLKKFCSSQCSKIWMRENSIGWWAPESLKNRSAYRDYD